MPFVKLDCQILDSSLWVDLDESRVFITALCMAIPHEITEPAPVLHIGKMEETGFVVPPGWYGFIGAAGSGIVRRSGIDLKKGMEALLRLSEPDQGSRSIDFEGRRLVRINKGFLILNYDKFREKDHTCAERSKRYRERKKTKNVTERHGVAPRDGVTRPRSVTQAEAEAEAEAYIINKHIPTEYESAAPTIAPDPPYKQFLKEWNQNATAFNLPIAKRWTTKRKTAFAARWRSSEWRRDYQSGILRIGKSPFLTGDSERGWRANIDWFLRPDTLTLIMEGKYDGPAPEKREPTQAERKAMERMGVKND